MHTSMAARLMLASAVLAVAGCAGGSQVAGTPAPPLSSAPAGQAGRSESLSPSGRLVRTGTRSQAVPAGPAIRFSKKAKDLFVTLDSDVAVLQNKTWNNLGTIGNGAMACPDGDWVDKKGNLYVADWQCYQSNSPGVYEFKPGASEPSMVYTAGLTDPVNVTTDKLGNVYVMDFFGGTISEYKQGHNTLRYQCAAPVTVYNGIVGAAVDPQGNVFVVSVNSESPWSTDLYEYAGGLNGCSATQLALYPGFPGGMVLDKNANLLVVDQGNNVVNVIAPPYSGITSQISALDPFMVTINKKNDQIYVTSLMIGSSSTGAVLVDAYPSGSNIATLGASNGISNPGAAVDTLNYVP